MGDNNSTDGTGDAVPVDSLIGDEVMGDEVMVCRADAVLTRRLLDGVIVLAPNASEPVRVSAPGEVLWSLLDEPCAIGDLVSELHHAYLVRNRDICANKPLTW